MRKELLVGALSLFLGVIFWGLWAGLQKPQALHLPKNHILMHPFKLPLVKQTGSFTLDNLMGHPSIIHIFASWCETCQAEKSQWKVFASTTKVPIYAVAYRDEPQNIIKMLRSLFSIYRAVAYDNKGDVMIDWGSYGTPEILLVNSNAEIVYRHAGPMSETFWKETILPKLDHLDEF